MRANGRRNILAAVGVVAFALGAVDAYNNIFPDASPATFWFWGSSMLTASVLRRKER